jgi:hypothetical protein
MPLVNVEPPMLSGQSAGTGRIEQLANKQKDMTDSAEMAWAAWLGYYNGNLKKLGWTSTELVQASLNYATSLGLAEVRTYSDVHKPCGLARILTFFFYLSDAEEGYIYLCIYIQKTLNIYVYIYIHIYIYKCI